MKDFILELSIKVDKVKQYFLNLYLEIYKGSYFQDFDDYRNKKGKP